MSSNKAVIWPDALMSRFPNGSSEFKAIEAKRSAFFEMFPEAAAQGSGESHAQRTQDTPRSGVLPDFTIENGSAPIDPSRVVELTGIPTSEFVAERLGASIDESSWL